MAFLPVEASAEITAKYKRYLSTIFEFKDKDYQKQFDSLLDKSGQFANGPFLDVTDSFEKGDCINDLIAKGKLPVNFKRLNINLTRPLYRHQQEAIEKALSGKNMVVSTGTGSGKTESFLIPVVSEIISEYESGKLDAGVRALLIYPMNALANDQMERLRELLKDYPEITYGSYTGQTKNRFSDAFTEYKALNDGREPDTNELISREQMKDAPPHIMITNYAMLEYLMIRPDDSVFFSEEMAHKWKYVVLDEAHVYAGSTGIEVSMLLRRLKATLGNNDIKYILTSATLGDDKSNNEVAQFASNLCAAHFSEKDVVRASRVDVLPGRASYDLTADFYRETAEAILKDEPNVERISEIIAKYGPKPDVSQSIDEQIYDAVINDKTFLQVKNYLKNPKKIRQISKEMGWSAKDTEQFVAVSSKAIKNGINLFDARYHMFLRATDGVFITLAPDKHVFFDRTEYYINSNGTKLKVFEAGTCSFCHSIFLLGEIKKDENRFIQSGRKVMTGQADVLLLADVIDETDEDTFDEEEIGTEAFDLCPYCGFIRRAGLKKSSCCEHGEQSLVRVWKVKKNENKAITKCPACETTNPFGIVRMFFTGQEAVTSVIGTALFESLPSYKITFEKKELFDESGFEIEEVNNEFKVSEAKQFIAFSDSRQAAAFYASYMDKTYKTILYKRFIVEVLRNGIDISGRPLSFFVDNLISEFEKNNICDQGTYVKKEAWKAVLEELVDNNGKTSLTKMGLLRITINDDIKIPGNPKWGLSTEEVRTICDEFLLSMLSNAAVTQSKVPLTKEDNEDYTHGGVLSTFTYSDSDAGRRRKAFIPTRQGLSNKRLDYINKIAVKVGMPDDDASCLTLLKGIWDHLLTNKDRNILTLEDGAYRVNAEALSFKEGKQWYICPKCKTITCNNVKGVCPTYKCEGELEPIDINEQFSGNHYYEMYQNLEMRPLRIVEHTAQLSRDESYEYQKRFKNKEIDILSCSTTFEMGVDVGTLETVFMRNMPPSPSNYAQRAGRAGRSIESAAFALTFCNKSNHDFTFFNEPISMIRGKILPPAFNVNNEKIAIRHIYASAASFFWKKNPEFFSTAKNMMGDGLDSEPTGFDQFLDYIGSKPEDLKDYIKAFLPKKLISDLQVETYGWLEGLVGQGDNPGILTRAEAEYKEEVNILLAEREELNKQMRGDGFVLQRLRTFYNEPIIAFLSRKGVFPRYGFPVDTVELSIPSGTVNQGVFGLQLQRDLSMAISEYVPGSQIVANGNLITSRYIKKAPTMLWKMYDYRICDECKSISISTHTEAVEKEEENVCSVCGKPATKSDQTFIIPEFGFIADGNNIRKPSLIKPNRTYNNEIAYVGNKDDAFREFDIGNSEILMMQSQKDEMVVINESHFFVCPVCGYTEVDDKTFSRVMRKEHKDANGYRKCKNKDLRRYSLGYRFSTNVLQIRFMNPTLPAVEWDHAYSVLQGIIRGFCSYFSIDERDVSGCLQYFRNEKTGNGAYSIVFYDKVPGGSGYVSMLDTPDKLKAVLERTRDIMNSCVCGGENGDASCYSCLRNYYNQRHHDEMKRRYVIDFIDQVL